jgi:tetratricopeptide (TPR) repeat protein
MAIDDDIAAHLPQPPLPAPAQRQAALDEATRRFDAARSGQPIAAERPTAPGPSWARIGRPQVAALVTVGLVLLFGVPAAWIAVDHRPSSKSDAMIATAEVSAPNRPPPAVPKVQPEPPASETPPPIAAPKSAVPAQPTTALASNAPKDYAPADRGQAVSNPGSAASGAIELVQADAASVAEKASGAKRDVAADKQKAMRFASAPPAALAPPPAPSMPEPKSAAGRSSEAFAAGSALQKPSEDTRDQVVTAHQRSEAVMDVVVTGRRVSLPRGDWNACTVNDPVHDLGKCRTLVNPAAGGAAGRAADHIADGLTQAWNGDYGRAVDAFDRAIAIQPRLSFAHLNRGLAYQRQGRFDRALADFDKAVRYDLGGARGYFNRGRLLRALGEAKRAEADEDRALAIDPSYDEVVR